MVYFLVGTMHFKLETKFSQMVKGMIVILVLKALSESLNVSVLKLLLEKVVNCGLIASIVVFQPEIRSGLQYLGRIMHLRKKINLDEGIYMAVEKAVQYMSKRKIGALITIERNMSLDEFVETGTQLNADITGELLITIFTPGTPLHDGAAVIRSGKILAASAYLPLSHSKLVSNKYGTRHRAALGISEASDSLTVVISEETGEISVTFEGVLLDELTLENCLQIVRSKMTWM